MIRGSVCRRVGAMLVLVLVAVAAGVDVALGIVDATDPRIQAAEARLRVEIETGAGRIQRTISSGVTTVMATRPASTFRLRNAVQAASNGINAASREETRRIAELVRTAVDALIAEGVGAADVSRLADRFDTEVADQFDALARNGVTDVSALVRNGRRIPSVRGTQVGVYALFVSQPENGRAPVKLGEVTLGDSQMVRGLISTARAAEFFLAGLEGPTPRIGDLPAATSLRAVRWLNRGGTLAVSSDDSAGQTRVAVDQSVFSVTGVDLLPERLRIELERRLEGAPEITSNPRGADGFFQSVTYTFRRIDK